MAPTQQQYLFPTYLLPTFTRPFKRRKSSTTSTTSDSPPSLSSSPRSSFSSPSSSLSSTSPLTSPSNLHRALHLQNITEILSEDTGPHLQKTAPNTLKCSTCATDLAFASQIVSKGFTGRHGRAFLVAPPDKAPLLINTKIGRNVSRELLTGAHVVADVSCVICGTTLGWKYVDARESQQRYKIGKFILEMKRVVVAVSWEDVAWSEDDTGVKDVEIFGEEEEEGEKGDNTDGVVVFDSEDEDECEDLFAGVWDAEVVAKRRNRRFGRRNRGD